MGFGREKRDSRFKNPASTVARRGTVVESRLGLRELQLAILDFRAWQSTAKLVLGLKKQMSDWMRRYSSREEDGARRGRVDRIAAA